MLLLVYVYRHNTGRYTALGESLKRATQEIFHDFFEDRNHILLITDKPITIYERQMIVDISKNHNNSGVYVIHIGKVSQQYLWDNTKVINIKSASINDVIKRLPFLKGMYVYIYI